MRFIRYELRTMDVHGARDFYTKLLGSSFWGSDVVISQLPGQAAAKGAVAHWLGLLGVGDTTAIAEHFLSRGAKQLGPTVRRETGEHIILRDPYGAHIALNTETKLPKRDIVHWHILHTRDHEAAFQTYSNVLGWVSTELIDLGPEQGIHQGFSWNYHTSHTGSISNAALSPKIHPQWLFFFRTPSMQHSLEVIRTQGGYSLKPIHATNGDLVVACDDNQGAAFGLIQPAT